MTTAAAFIGLLVGTSIVLSFAAHIIKASYSLARRIEIIHDVVVRELVPNGGGALVDRVTRIEQRLDDAA